jgi:hypothetical protein
MSAVAAVPQPQVRLYFPATCGDGLGERRPASPLLERVLRYPDRFQPRPAAPALALVRQ